MIKYNSNEFRAKCELSYQDLKAEIEQTDTEWLRGYSVDYKAVARTAISITAELWQACSRLLASTPLPWHRQLFNVERCAMALLYTEARRDAEQQIPTIKKMMREIRSLSAELQSHAMKLDFQRACDALSPHSSGDPFVRMQEDIAECEQLQQIVLDHPKHNCAPEVLERARCLEKQLHRLLAEQRLVAFSQTPWTKARHQAFVLLCLEHEVLRNAIGQLQPRNGRPVTILPSLFPALIALGRSTQQPSTPKVDVACTLTTTASCVNGPNGQEVCHVAG